MESKTPLAVFISDQKFHDTSLNICDQETRGSVIAALKEKGYTVHVGRAEFKSDLAYSFFVGNMFETHRDWVEIPEKSFPQFVFSEVYFYFAAEANCYTLDELEECTYTVACCVHSVY